MNREISVDTNTAQQSTNLFFSGEQLSERSDDDIYSDGDNSDWSDVSDIDSDYEPSDTESEPDEI